MLGRPNARSNAYNNLNKVEPPIQLVLDFTDDVTERMTAQDDAA